MADQPEAPGNHGTSRRGLAFAVAAAGLAALFLFLPISLPGVAIQTLAALAQGEILAWQSSVGLTLSVLAGPALLSTILLVIPFLLLKAAQRLLGRSRATLWVGGLLAALLACVAVVWLVAGGSEAMPISETPEFWYAAAFGAAALVTLVVSVLVARQAVVAALAMVGVALAGLVVLTGALIAVWGSPPRIPADAQTVVIVSTPDGVGLQPAQVKPGEVYFIVEGADDMSGHADFEFIAAGLASDNTPLPLSYEGLERLSPGDYLGTYVESGWGQYTKWTLLEGSYAFATLPRGVGPESITLLKVAP
jgi:hypothetical protein